MVSNAKTCSCFLNYFTTTWVKWLKTLNLQVNLCCCNGKHRILVMPKMHDKLTFVLLNFLWENRKIEFLFNIAGCWNSIQVKTRILLLYKIIIMIANILVTQGSMTSAAMVLASFACNIPVSVPERVINFVQNTHNVMSSRSGLCSSLTAIMLWGNIVLYRPDSRFSLSQWETPLQSNGVSHWLDANLESALLYCTIFSTRPNNIRFKQIMPVWHYIPVRKYVITHDISLLKSIVGNSHLNNDIFNIYSFHTTFSCSNHFHGIPIQMIIFHLTTACLVPIAKLTFILTCHHCLYPYYIIWMQTVMTGLYKSLYIYIHI